MSGQSCCFITFMSLSVFLVLLRQTAGIFDIMARAEAETVTTELNVR